MNITVIGRGNVGGGPAQRRRLCRARGAGARMLEEHPALMFAVKQAGLGPFFYRMWSPRSG